jgi:hypothetical protein
MIFLFPFMLISSLPAHLQLGGQLPGSMTIPTKAGGAVKEIMR